MPSATVVVVLFFVAMVINLPAYLSVFVAVAVVFLASAFACPHSLVCCCLCLIFDRLTFVKCLSLSLCLSRCLSRSIRLIQFGFIFIFRLSFRLNALGNCADVSAARWGGG